MACRFRRPSANACGMRCVERHPALARFANGAKPEDPADDQEDVTAAVAAWVTDTVREALDGDDEAARAR